MKKLIYILIFALCLSGCNKAINGESKSQSGSGEILKGESSALTRASFSTSEGRYVVAYTTDRPILCYVDYATATQMPLCSQPSCPHNAEGCTALLPEDARANEIYCMGDKLAVATYGAYAEQAPKLLFMDKDGSSCKEMYVGPSGNQIGTILAVDNENIYFILRDLYDEKSRLCINALPLSGGEARSVYEFTNNGFEFAGVNGRNIYMYNYDWSAGEGKERPKIPEGTSQEEMDRLYEEFNASIIGKHWIEEINIDTGESKTIMEWTSQMGSTGKSIFMKTNTLYWLDKTHLGKINPDGSQEQLAINWQLAEKDIPTRIEVITDTKAILRVHNDGVGIRYVVDLATGDVTTANLTFIANGREQPISIGGVSPEGLLIQYDCRMESVVEIMKDGTATDSNKVTNSYAMITYEDFYASKPNYKSIDTPFQADIFGY